MCRYRLLWRRFSIIDVDDDVSTDPGCYPQPQAQPGPGQGQGQAQDEQPEPPSNLHRTTPKYRTTTTVLRGEFELIGIITSVPVVMIFKTEPEVFKYLIYFLFCYKYFENNLRLYHWIHFATCYRLSWSRKKYMYRKKSLNMTCDNNNNT